MEEPELNMVGGRVDVCDRRFPLHPAAVSPLDRLLEVGSHSVDELPQRPNDTLIPWDLIGKVRIEGLVGLHLHHCAPFWRLTGNIILFIPTHHNKMAPRHTSKLPCCG